MLSKTFDTNNKKVFTKKTKVILSLNKGHTKEIIIINQVVTQGCSLSPVCLTFIFMTSWEKRKIELTQELQQDKGSAQIHYHFQMTQL